MFYIMLSLLTIVTSLNPTTTKNTKLDTE